MRKTRRSKPPQRNQRITYSTVRALIPLDTETLRKKELSAFKRIKTTHATLTDQITQFEKKDLPEFQQWMRTHGGPIEEQLQAESKTFFILKNVLLVADELCEFYRNRTEKECAEAALHYVETRGEIPKCFEAFFAPPQPDPEDSDDSFGEEDDGQNEDSAEFRKFMDSLMDDEPDDETASFFHRLHPQRSLSDELHQQKQTLKKLYRSIVRKLHPDRAGSSTPEQQELWHTAKHAYTMGDIKTLAHIESHCDLIHKDLLKCAAVSSIRSGILFYKKANEKIRYEIRKVKAQPEWKFSSRPEQMKMRLIQHLVNNLKSQLSHLSAQRQDVERALEKMKNSHRKRSRRAHSFFYSPSDLF